MVSDEVQNITLHPLQLMGMLGLRHTSLRIPFHLKACIEPMSHD